MILPNDPEYQCVMAPVSTIELKAETYKVNGIHVKIPTRTLFITDDGSVYVVSRKRKDGTHSYVSLKTLIEAIKNTTIIENFSTPPKP